MNSTLKIWHRIGKTGLGRWLFSKMLCLKAPYFATIKPLILSLTPGHCELTIRKRRGVHNHLGTVHAIAMCNMAELAGGLMTDVSIPLTHRWIPVGMTVRYLKKAKSDLRAVASLHEGSSFETEGVCKVLVEVKDSSDQTVFDAVISMMVSKKPT